MSVSGCNGSERPWFLFFDLHCPVPVLLMPVTGGRREPARNLELRVILQVQVGEPSIADPAIHAGIVGAT